MKIAHVPTGIMISYHIKGSANRKVKIAKQLYGFTDSTKQGKYIYKRKGILQFPYIKAARSTLIIKFQHAADIKKFFKKEKIGFSERIVFLNQHEAHKLRVGYGRKWKNVLSDARGSKDLLVTVDF
tara:strand:- start:2039 stop:2416 length:378 start_codon:yes stop_codon:yes gene_type:complete